MWRDATSADDNAIIAMCLSLNTEDPGLVEVPPTNMHRTLRTFREHPERGTPLVLELDGTAEGYALLVPYWSNEFGGHVCVIDEVYVRPPHRGRGHLTRLVEQLARRGHPAAANAVALSLAVNTANTKARRTYEHLGFRGDNTNMQRLLEPTATRSR